VVGKSEDDKDNQPNAQCAQRQDEQALQKPFQQSHHLAAVTAS
jgi:hypothetical protein